MTINQISIVKLGWLGSEKETLSSEKRGEGKGKEER
jgi:hypothetical protein